MNFKEIHTIVRDLPTDKEGYIKITHLLKNAFGHQSRYITRELNQQNPIFHMLRIRGTNEEPGQWKIHAHDSIEFTLRVWDLVKEHSAEMHKGEAS